MGDDNITMCYDDEEKNTAYLAKRKLKKNMDSLISVRSKLVNATHNTAVGSSECIASLDRIIADTDELIKEISIYLLR